MLVAVSILAISLTILVYKHPPATWLRFLSAQDGPIESENAAKISQNGSAHHTDKEQAEPPIQITLEPEEISESSPSPQTTPKAAPSSSPNGIAIPTFALAEHESSEDEEEDMPPPSFPALNSAQRASAQPSMMLPPQKPASMAPPPKPSLMAPPPKPAAPSLMPPPQTKSSNLRALPTPTQGLRVPTTGPLPNRGPVPNRSPNGGLAPQPTAGLGVKTPNARGKMVLTPGHSPLDWANLQKSGKNLAGVPSLIRVSPSMLKHNNGRKGKPAWSSYQGKVYNITPYLPFHPGGEGELRRAAGKDGGKLFMEVHPWVNWENMLGECVVGIMVTEEQAQAESSGGSLEDMD